MNKIIVLFGHKRAIEEAKELDLYVVNILKNEMINNKTYQNATQISDITVFVNNNEDIVKTIENLTKFDDYKAIVSFTDTNDGVKLAATLNEKFIKHNNYVSPSVVELLIDKHSTRKYVDSIGLKNINYILPKNIEDSISFYEAHGKKIVAKPINGQGSKSVAVLSNIADIIKYHNENGTNDILIEEYVDGNEISVETITINKKTHILGITQKHLLGYNTFSHNPQVEIGHEFPATLSKSLEDNICEYVIAFFDNLNVINGLGHTELMVRKEEPILIESHLRAGGDNIPRLIYNSTKLKIYKEFYRSLLSFNNLEIKYYTKSAIKYMVCDCGIIDNYKINSFIFNDGVIEKNGLTIKEKMRVNKIECSFDRNCGFLIVNDNDDPYEKASKLIEQVEVVIK